MSGSLENSLPEYYYSGSRSEVVPFIPEQYSRVLEIGCARGQFRDNLRPDCEYWGVEPTTENAKEASNRLNMVLHGLYEDVQGDLPNAHFDLVICNDVIEHMADENAFLESIREKLVDGGCLIGSVPNMRYVHALFELLVLKDWRYRDSGILDRTHLRFFTEKSLKRTFSRHQFEILKFSGIGSISDKRTTPKVVLINSLILCLQVLTLGYYADLKHIQFGFCIRKAARPSL